jgi:hypothetical protein
MRTVEITLSDEEYESLQRWAERSGYSLHRLLYDILRPAIEQAQRVRDHQKPDLYQMTAKERAARFRTAYRS